MGWFEKNDQGQYVLGHNLNMEFRDGRVPDNRNIELRNSKNDSEYYQVTTDGGGTTWIWLSFSVNWRFTNLNVAFVPWWVTHANAPRVLVRGRKQYGGEPRDRFVARNPVQARRTRHHVL